MITNVKQPLSKDTIFPALMRAVVNENLIVLVFSAKPGDNVIIATGTSAKKVGERYLQSDMDRLKSFHGSITLEND